MTSAATTLPPETPSVPAARRFVCETLAGWGLPHACDVAEMLVSEVVTNAVLHARTEITVEVSRIGDRVRVVVLDLSPVIPRQRSYGVDSTTGRGLRLVATMATSWGTEPLGPGKAVWFEVPASGSADSDFEEWQDEVDVDALLAAFDDDDEVAESPVRQP